MRHAISSVLISFCAVAILANKPKLDSNTVCHIGCIRDVQRAIGGHFDGKESCLCDVPLDFEALTQPIFLIQSPRHITVTKLDDMRQETQYDADEHEKVTKFSENWLPNISE